jgi:hypothetical protein
MKVEIVKQPPCTLPLKWWGAEQKKPRKVNEENFVGDFIFIEAHTFEEATERLLEITGYTWDKFYSQAEATNTPGEVEGGESLELILAFTPGAVAFLHYYNGTVERVTEN